MELHAIVSLSFRIVMKTKVSFSHTPGRTLDMSLLAKLIYAWTNLCSHANRRQAHRNAHIQHICAHMQQARDIHKQEQIQIQIQVQIEIFLYGIDGRAQFIQQRSYMRNEFDQSISYLKILYLFFVSFFLVCYLGIGTATRRAKVFAVTIKRDVFIKNSILLGSLISCSWLSY